MLRGMETKHMMTPDPTFSVLCEDVRQEANGRFIFLGVFNDGIVVQRLPVRLMRLCVATRWGSGLMAPDGVTPVVEGKELEVALKNPVATHTNIENFLGVGFREPGVYWVEISLDGELRMRYPFAVRVPPAKSVP